MQEILGRIIEKHGPWAAFCIGLLAILWFVGKRFVKALDAMSASANTVAEAVNTSSRAQIVAFAALTDRVSRVEGKIEALGLAALGRPEQAQAAHAALAEAAQIADEFGDTGVQPIPTPTEPQAVPIIKPKPPKAKTPAKGSPYAVHIRPASKGGGK